jgi:threonylcarbamoyladenosine tRNA methylthiotransferase MtaB
VAVLTLGCKLNQAESDAIARELVGAGCRVVDRPAAADAYVINSCSVTHVADRKSRHLVRLARRLSPDATVVLTGCYPETAGMAIALATGADIVVPSRDKEEVVRRLLEFRPNPPTPLEVCGGPPADPAEGPAREGGAVPAHAPSPVKHGCASAPSTTGPDVAIETPLPSQGRGTGGLGRTRAFVKAQEGCNDVCAFCIVPRTRGRERSIPPAQVAATVLEREEDGAQEVVITGTQLGAYGRDLDAMHYGPAAVIRAVLAETSVPRIRFSSLQPQDITPELLALWDDPRLCRHFHLALQSGSDAVLRRMRRRYTMTRYREALELIRALVPDVAITTDVIVGFPGESETEAAESLDFCREAGFASIHVFPYSRRPGTTAHLLRDHVPEPVKRARMQEMLAAARESAADYRRRFLGRTMPVLWEGRHRGDEGAAAVWEGLTDNYIRVFTRSPHDLSNQLIPVTLVSEAKDGLWGDSVSGPLWSSPITHLPVVEQP